MSDPHSNENDSAEQDEELRGGVDLSAIDPERWAQAKIAREEIERLLLLNPRTVEDVKRAAKRLGCGITWLYTLMHRYEADRTLTSLLPRDKNGGRGQPRIDPDIERMIAEVIEEFHLTDLKLKPVAVLKEVAHRCRKLGWKAPSHMTVRKRIDAISGRVSTRRRLGGIAARDRYDPTVGRYPETKWPLSVVQIDHTKVDIQVVDEETRQAIGRPYITVAIDVKTRSILGMYLSLEAPSSASVGLCLVHATLPKVEWLRRRGIDADWPMYGKPDKIYVDNGSDFRSEALSLGCAEHGIEKEHRPIKRPSYGGAVERVIGTLMAEVQKLPGTTFSNVAARGTYDSGKNATLTLAELEVVIANFITHEYHERPHQTLHISPRRAWEKGIQGDGDHLGRGAPELIRNETKFLIDFLPMAKRSVQRYGIVWDRIHYYDDVLRRYIDNDDKRKFVVRRDPRDISRLFFRCPDSQSYFEIPYRNITRPALTLWEQREAVRVLKAEGQEHVDEDLIFRGYERNQELVAGAVKEKKKARRNAARKTEAVRSAEATPAAVEQQSRAPDESGPVVKPTPSPAISDDTFDDIEIW